MPSTITASVGRAGGVNRFQDVLTVQRLLNQVPPLSGGPFPPLVPDGFSGTRTVGAIQKFQLQHFGWSGADGRVDPGGQTLKKLNEFDVPFLTTASILLCAHGGPVQAVVTNLFGRPSIAPGVFALHVQDVYTVTGCPFVLVGPSPCVTVLWFTPLPTGFLNTRSVGTGVAAANLAQGPVIVAKV